MTGLDRLDRIALAVAAAAILCQVLVPPVVGLADNGDFPKIIGRFSLHQDVADSDAYFRFATTRYLFDPTYYWNRGFVSSETPLAWIAVQAAKVCRGDRSFDIRFLGVLHTALFMAIFALALPLFHRYPARPRKILTGLAILMFTDIMYVEYFNSFYMDTAAFLFLLGAIVFFLRARYLPQSKIPAAPVFLIFCWLFLLSKAQHAPTALPLILFSFSGCVLLWPSWPALSRGIAAVSIAGCAMFAYFHTPKGYADPPLFTVIFFSLLPSAENPSQELRELGLDDSFLRYRGLGAYTPGSPMANWAWSDKFGETTSYGKLAFFYLRHPWRAAHVLGLGLDQGTFQRPPNIGNFDKSAGYAPSARSYRFPLWSSLKLFVFGGRGWFYLTYWLAALAVVVRRCRGFGLLLGWMAALALAVGAMADSAETTRHLFIFSFLLDVTVFLAVASILRQRKSVLQ